MSDGNGDRPNRPNGQRPPGPNRVQRPVFGWLLFIGLALILATFLSQSLAPKSDKISIDEFWTRAKNNDIEELVIRGNTIIGRLKAGLQGTAEGSLERFELKYPSTAITQEFFDKFRMRSWIVRPQVVKGISKPISEEMRPHAIHQRKR